jgi:plastocyanin
MFTTDSRFFLAIAAVAAIAAAFYAGISGDRSGALPLVGVAAAAALVGGLLVGTVVRTDVLAADAADGAGAAAPPEDGPATASIWPALSAIAVIVFLVGLVLDVPLLVLGVVAVAVAAAGWVSQAWSEAASIARPDAVEASRRVLGPAALPVVSFLAAAFVIVMMSRILLAVSKNASTVIAIVVAAAILGFCALLALAPRVANRAGGAIVALAAAGLTVGGIVAAAEGERTVEAHGGGPIHIAAVNIAFDPATLELHGPGKTVMQFENGDEGVQHNVAIYTDETAAEALFVGQVITGSDDIEYIFDTPPPGEYFFRCDVHPVNMVGTVEVAEAEGEHGGE